MKKIVILGGGITGLTLAWLLSQRAPENKISLIEKNSRLGGWVNTIEKGGFLFEQGPRALRLYDEDVSLHQFIQDLGLEKKCSSPLAKKKYLWVDGSLHPLPTHPLSLFFSPLMRGCIAALFKERRVPLSSLEDETVESFFLRRFNEKIVSHFVDPFVSGIFAGNPSELSMRSCFPSLLEKEKTHGSLVKGFLSTKKKSRLFTLEKGMKEFVTVLSKKLEEKGVEIQKESEVLRIEQRPGKALLTLSHQVVEADLVLSTLSLKDMAPLLPFPLPHLPYASLALVNIGYQKAPSKPLGFGLLIPSKEKEKILGITFDSDIFPHFAPPGGATLTVMMGGTRHPLPSPSEALDLALSGLRRFCNIYSQPDHTHISFARHAIPQYPPFYHRTLASLHTSLHTSYPSLHCLGFHGIGLPDCLSKSFHCVDKLLK